MYRKIFLSLNNYILEHVSEERLNAIQKNLIDSNIYIKAEQFITAAIIFMASIFLLSSILSLLLNLSIIIPVLVTASFIILTLTYIYYQKEKRLENIELELPNYLKQVSSLLKVGLGLESAFNEISKTMDNDLNNEIKRALAETSLGKSFDEALMDLAKRNRSENLEHTFKIMIRSKESGGNLADILESMSKDLSDAISLKKERKTNVMMSVMFLLISSTIATPFSLGMIGLYSDFIATIGRTSPLSEVIPITSIGYIIIQAVLVSILMGIVLYSNAKKGLKFIIFIVPSAVGVFIISQMIFRGILGV